MKENEGIEQRMRIEGSIMDNMDKKETIDLVQTCAKNG